MSTVLLVTTRSYAWTALEGTLIRHLPARGFRPVLACGRPGEVTDEAARQGTRVAIVPGVADVRTGRGLLRLGGTLVTLARLVRRHDVRLIHSLRGSCALPALLVSALTGIPHLCHLQFLYASPRKYRALGLDRARNVAAPARAVLDAYRAASPRAARARRFLVPYGLDADGFVARAGSRDVRAELGIAPGAVLVLMVGSLDHRKDPQTLLRALAQLPPGRQETHAVFLGRFRDPAYERETRALAAGLRGVTCHFPGFDPRPSAWFRAADLFALPTRGDALPVVLLEAMAHGKPVVASAVGGVPEAVSPGVSGFLAEPGDPASFASAVGALIADRDLREKMGRRAREDVRRAFSIDAEMRAVEGAYRACGA